MICPHGHESQADDFCDTCGAKIDPDQQPAPPAPPATEPGAAEGDPVAQTCPHCHTLNLPDALFCEACGYDFTTGALPRGAAPATGPGSPPAAAGPDVPAPPAGEPAAAPPVGDPAATPPAPSGPQWVAEVWVDPDWYAGQDAEEPMPSPGLPTVVALLTRSLLVGRVSASRNIHPDVDCTSDSGVSRRHAQLTTDGSRWFVEDLDSANGTFVGPASGPLPLDPIAVGPRTELGADDRIYVGAWTRIVVRTATDDEVAAQQG